jgi:hypothetical protein
MGVQSVTCLQWVPELVGLGEPGLTPLDLPGRAFRVCKPWRGYLAKDIGRLGVFVDVRVNFLRDWETCVRFAAGTGFLDDVDLFEFLACVELSRIGRGGKVEHAGRTHHES